MNTQVVSDKADVVGLAGTGHEMPRAFGLVVARCQPMCIGSLSEIAEIRRSSKTLVPSVGQHGVKVVFRDRNT